MYEVMVSNIGLVHTGEDSKAAYVVFNAYQIMSKANLGRSAGSSVTLLQDGDVIEDYEGEGYYG